MIFYLFSFGSKIVEPSYEDKNEPQLMSLRPACQTSLTSFRLHLHHTESFSLEVHFILSTQASREHHSFQDTQTIR